MDLRVVTAGEFASAAAGAVRDAIHRSPRSVLGLPTGRTMIPVYKRLAAEPPRFVANAAAFAIDEYCWPDAAHPGTNASFFAAYWQAVPGAPPVAVPPADAAEPDAAISNHCRAIAAAGGFGLVILGIGENGHIAFNEPGSGSDSGCRVVPLTDASRRQVESVWPEPPTRGMTVGVREILNAGQVILLAAGEAKRDALSQALTSPPSEAIPASFLQRHPSLTVVCDTAAATLLAL